ncbi:MAG: serine protease, partial [Oleiphilaceae bacterium]
TTPLLAGVAAIVKQATGASDELLKKAIRVTSSPAYFGSGCSIDMCGAGVLNAKKLLEFATKDVGDTLNSISFALDANTACDQTWFLDFFGNNAHLCELYKVTFMGGYTNAGTTYKLLSIASTDDWLVTSPYVEGEFDKGNVVLRALDPDNRKYAVQYCIDGICDEIIEMNTAGAKAAKRPIACLNK